MPRIALTCIQVVAHDAVGNDVVAMHRLLSGRGTHEIAVFAESANVPGLPIRPPTELPDFLRDPADVLLFHHGTGWQNGCDLFRRIRCRKILRYHNVTPVRIFEGLSEYYAHYCRLGREQAAGLRVGRLRPLSLGVRVQSA